MLLHVASSADSRHSTLLGNAFLHLAVESTSRETRSLTLVALSNLTLKNLELVTGIVCASLKAYLTKEKPTAAKAHADGEEGTTKSVRKDTRLCAYLLACGPLSDVEPAVRERVMVELLVISHHPSLGTSSRRSRSEYVIHSLRRQAPLCAYRGSGCARPPPSTRTSLLWPIQNLS